MKKLVFAALAAVFVLSSGFSSIDTSTIFEGNELQLVYTKVYSSTATTIDYQYEIHNYECMYRECTYQNGVLVGCTPWKPCDAKAKEILAELDKALKDLDK